MEKREHEPLAHHTTLRVGGPARYVFFVNSIDDLHAARLFAIEHNVPILLLGQGSNVLVSEQGFSGVVIINRITGKQYVPIDDQTVHATYGAGEDWDTVVADSVARELWGLENLSHIPGTVGATPIQNVGAYGTEVSDIIQSVSAVHLQTGEEKTFTATACQFGYRDSYFKSVVGRNWCVVAVTFVLTPKRSPITNYADIKRFVTEYPDCSAADIRNKVIEIRSTKFPNWQNVGTAGSFFKNPIVIAAVASRLQQAYPMMPQFHASNNTVKLSLGWILDHVCRLRGYSVGDVSLSEHQALVLINQGQSASAITDFVADVVQQVYDHTNLIIEPEVRVI